MRFWAQIAFVPLCGVSSLLLGATLPDEPVLIRDTFLSDGNETDGFVVSHPAIPPLRTTSDGRIGFSIKEHQFYLIKPELMPPGTKFVDSDPGVNLLGDGPLPVPAPLHLPDPTGHVLEIDHTAICEPNPGPTPCGPGLANDCYTISLIAPVIYCTVPCATSTARDHIELFKRTVTIEVQNPKTAAATILAIRNEEALSGPGGTAIPARNMFETMITDDGKLMVARFGGTLSLNNTAIDIAYAVASSPCNVTTWTEFDSITKAHENTNATAYGISKYPLLDAEGTPITAGLDLYGTYPWIDRKGNNLFFTSVSATLFYSASPFEQFYTSRYPVSCVPGVPDTLCRDEEGHPNHLYPTAGTRGTLDDATPTRGVSVAGLWTRGKTVLLDGLLNNVDYGLEIEDYKHRMLDLYGSCNDGSPPCLVRAGSGRYNQTSLTQVPSGFVTNSTFIDSSENLYNAFANMRPATPRDVVWIVNTGHGSDEIAFDDYLDPNVYIYSEMTAALKWEDSAPRNEFIYQDGFDRTASWTGNGFIPANLRVQNASTSLNTEWTVPLHGTPAGNLRIEPVALGGIRGKGLWLDGASSLSYAIDTDETRSTWFIGLFVDPRLGAGAPEATLMTFPDGSKVTLPDLNTVRVVPKSGAPLDFDLGAAALSNKAWSHLGFVSEDTGHTVELYVDGEWIDALSAVAGATAMSMTDGSLSIGAATTGFRGWIDEFKVIGYKPNLEVLCNHAFGTLVRQGTTTYCHTDYSADFAAHLGSLPPDTTSERAQVLFPEGPLQYNRARPDSTSNDFCNSCHVSYSPSPPTSLSVAALVPGTAHLQYDPRRQPLMPARVIDGIIPAFHYGALPLTPLLGPQFQDKWVFPFIPADNTCFAAGTPITMADGSTLEIEFVQVGDLVLAYDELTGEVKPGRVSQTFVHPQLNDLVSINGVAATADHPIMTQGGWVNAGSISTGDILVGLQHDGSEFSAMPTEVMTLTSVQSLGTVYNMEVEGLDTYFAGGILVHNKNTPSSQQGHVP